MPQRQRHPLDLWHLLSLDAPTVAALWCWTLGRVADLYLPGTAPLMLALGAWLLYVSDRLLDGLLARDPLALRERHRFHQRHRRAFVISAVAACAVLLWLVLTRLPARVLHEDLWLATCALTYLVVVHLRSLRIEASAWGGSFPKELAVAVVFAAATAVPAWARLTPRAPARTQLMLVTFLFAAICWLNCVAIEAWEAEVSGAALEPSHSTLWLGNHLALASCSLGLLAGALAVDARIASAASLPEAASEAAIALSAFSFAALHRVRRSLSPLRLRVAADAALLTPLLFFPFLR